MMDSTIYTPERTAIQRIPLLPSLSVSASVHRPLALRLYRIGILGDSVAFCGELMMTKQTTTGTDAMRVLTERIALV